MMSLHTARGKLEAAMQMEKMPLPIELKHEGLVGTVEEVIKMLPDEDNYLEENDG